MKHRTKTATEMPLRGSAKIISAKDILVAPIDRAAANAMVKRHHYSGKIVGNSQLHLGVFLNGDLEGVLQFGPSLDKRKIQGLVRDTSWNGFLELNRMAFSDRLPRNSESRALAISFRLIRQHYPHIEWVISFADGTQSGDGTIYRASGFVLTGIRKNTTIWSSGDVVDHDIAVKSQPHKKSEIFSRVSLTDGRSKHEPARALTLCNRVTVTKGQHMENGGASMTIFKEAGFKPLPGFQLRYIYFLDPTAKERLTVPILPFSKIDELGARMYLGQAREKQAMAGVHPDQRRGSTDPHAPKQRPRLKGVALLGMSAIREIKKREKRRPFPKG